MNALETQITLQDWHALYMKCTPKEREEITISMLQRIESRDKANIEYLKEMPLALEGLSPSKLMDVVEVAMVDASIWLLENCPNAREKLFAYETLTIFYLDQVEKNARETREVIDAICQVWDVSLFPESDKKPASTTKSA